MQRFLIGLLLIVGGSRAAWAQAPTLTWQNEQLQGGYRYGVFDDYVMRNVFRTSRNRLAVIGYYRSHFNGLRTPGMLRFCAYNGDTLRTVLYPPPVSNIGDHYRELRQMDEAPNGDFFLCGVDVQNNNGNVTSNHLLIRTDSLGNPRWERTYGNGRGMEGGSCLALPDGGALLVRNVNDPIGTGFFPVRRAMATRVDSAGAVVWEQTFGQTYDSFCEGLLLADGSYALVGNKTMRLANPVRFEVFPWVVRVAADGTVLSDRVDYSRSPGDEYVFTAAATPGGGLVLGGYAVWPLGSTTSSVPELVQLDSAGRREWRQLLVAPATGADISKLLPLAQPGQVLVAGTRALNLGRDGAYVARYDALAGGAGAAMAWEGQYTGIGGPAVPGPGGTLTWGFSGSLNPYQTRRRIVLTRLTGLPPLYQVLPCAVPVTAYFATSVDAAGTELRVLESVFAGPPRAQFVRYRWSWGDGTTSDGPAPGPHRYAAPPRPGTAVRLTLTNNLGCTATHVEYPFGPLSTAAASRALQAGLTLAPNPATETTTLALPGLARQPPVPVQVLDALGRLVRSAALPVPAQGTPTLALDVRGLAPGLYVVRLLPREGPLTTRLVVR